MESIASRAARRARTFLFALAAMIAGSLAHAEDIDLFLGNPLAQQANAPNILIMLDNSANWSREAQKWPGGDQGVSELRALQRILANPQNANIGLALYTKVGNDMGGYMRFGIRNMGATTTGAANRAALSNILGLIRSNINDPIEKVNDSTGEAASLYEAYKYFKSMRPFRGMHSATTPNADEKNNNGSSAGRTAWGQGLTAEFAVEPNGNYLGPPVASCGRQYIIFIVNNAQGTIPEGQQVFEGVSAGAPLPVLNGVTDISWTDEWARFLYSQGISVYILDAWNAQQNKAHSAVLKRAASVGGGEYFAVNKEEDIDIALEKIKAQILATNTSFAAASLPISATNRSQNLNQVFIGMFRPDDLANPRWMGNLKQYKLAKNGTSIDLVDRLGSNAVNADTGFVDECATSFWTTGSGSYWETTRRNQLTTSGCTVFPVSGGVAGSKWSDFPDGPTVEKGGVAEILRKGNNPPVTDTLPPWSSTTRTILTYSASATGKVTALTAVLAGWTDALFSWVSGIDDPAASEFTDTGVDTPPRTRPSIHGDVIHSRPLPVNYGDRGVTVYYGANDGMLRAVDAATGRERWAYVAPEHYAAYQRLYDNAPAVSYSVLSPAFARPKDYFFDGSFGIYQNLDSSRVWIFPSMRRGGRMLYGFDVTDPASPRIKWRIGCPNLANDDGCTSDNIRAIGQTWSMPSVAFLKGYSTTTPVIVVGGGYDRCEDPDSTTLSCDSRKGNAIFVINADTGEVLRTFAPAGAGSFAADIALSDVNGDGSVDFAYAVDTIGNVYRIDFSDSSRVFSASDPEQSWLNKDNWGIRKVGYTTAAARKFLYPPSLLHVGTKMYVAVGSGNRERPLITNYPYTTPTVNRFYVLLDDLMVLPSSGTAAVNMDTDPGIKNYTSLASTSCTEEGVSPASGLKGWFMDLPGRGEQVVTSPLIAAGMVAFNTNRPDPTGNTCRSPLGVATGYWVNLVNASGAVGVGNKTCGGDRSSVFVGGGLTPSPTLARVVVDGKVVTVAIGAGNREGGPSITIDPQQIKPVITSRRKSIYWKSNTVE